MSIKYKFSHEKNNNKNKIINQNQEKKYNAICFHKNIKIDKEEIEDLFEKCFAKVGYDNKFVRKMNFYFIKYKYLTEKQFDALKKISNLAT